MRVALDTNELVDAEGINGADWRDTFPTAQTFSESMVIAAGLSTDHRTGRRDGVILSTAAQSGCCLRLSEDLLEGFTWVGGNVANPFSRPRHALLQSLLDEDAE